MRILHTLTALFVAVVASACDKTFSDPILAPLPTSETATGVWGGTIGITSILNISITEIPPAVAGGPATITGSGSLKSASCSRAVTVTGSGNSPFYTLSITETGTSTFEVVIDATLSSSGIGGPYTMAVGTAADACLPEATGFTLLGLKTIGLINGTYAGPWGPTNVFVTLSLQQSGDSVSGTADWTLYPCSTGAIFDGVLTGTSLVGTLSSLPFSSESDFMLEATWNPGLGTLAGPWVITKSGQLLGPCFVGEGGNMDLTLLTLPLSEPDPPPTHTVVYLGVESDGTQQEILIRNH